MSAKLPCADFATILQRTRSSRSVGTSSTASASGNTLTPSARTFLWEICFVLVKHRLCESPQPKCPVCHLPLTIDLESPALELEENTKPRQGILGRLDLDKWRSSSKIEALVEELSKLKRKDATTKSIVFSQFVNFLDLVAYRLQKEGFNVSGANVTIFFLLISWAGVSVGRDYEPASKGCYYTIFQYVLFIPLSRNCDDRHIFSQWIMYMLLFSWFRSRLEVLLWIWRRRRLYFWWIRGGIRVRNIHFHLWNMKTEPFNFSRRVSWVKS